MSWLWKTGVGTQGVTELLGFVHSTGLIIKCEKDR